jgi:hypothetical protein
MRADTAMGTDTGEKTEIFYKELWILQGSENKVIRRQNKSLPIRFSNKVPKSPMEN